MPSGADVAIIGGGVMGCGLAWRLAASGLRVVVIERDRPGAEASTAAAGILSPQVEMQASEPLSKLALASRDLYPTWSAALSEETGLDIGHRICGVLQLVGGAGQSAAATEAAFQAARTVLREQTGSGLHAEWIDPQALAIAEPALSRCAGALHFPDDGQVDPSKLCEALAQAATRRHAQFVRATVERIESRSGRVTGLALLPSDDASATEIAAERVVICAGSWSASIAGSPLPQNSIEPIRGQMLELVAAPRLVRGIVFGPLPSHGYLVPREAGRVLIGSTMERVGFHKQVTAQAMADLLSMATTLVPALNQAAFVRAWSGLRPASPDGLPILGPTSIDGLFVCTGHFRNGILLAPASAEALCAQMLGKSSKVLPSLDLRPFSPARLNPKKA